jgi:excisionase family DNA binding protein
MTKLLTLVEAATALRVSRRTLYRLIAEGHLRTLRVGYRRQFVEQREVDAYLAAQRKAAA